MANHEMRVYCGQSNAAFAERLSAELSRIEGRAVEVPCVTSRFNDGEKFAEFPESIRRSHVFLVQSTHQPDDHFMELLVMCDAAKRASVGEITFVEPYYGYGRQDRKVKPRVPITARLRADMLEAACAPYIPRRLLTADLHAGQIQGFFGCPVDNLEGLPVLLTALRREEGIDFSDVAFVSPDDGGFARCREAGKRVNCWNVTAFKKGRDREGRLVRRGGFILDPAIVKGRRVFIIDDLVATGGSLELTAVACVEAGATDITVVVVHPVLSTDVEDGMSAYERIAKAPIRRCYFADTIPFSEERAVWMNTPRTRDDRCDPERARQFFREVAPKIHNVSLAPYFAAAMHAVHHGDSVHELMQATYAAILAD